MLFAEMDVEFKSSSLREIQDSFREARQYFAESYLFKEFVNQNYVTNYQHFANIITMTRAELGITSPIREERKRGKPDRPQKEKKIKELKGHREDSMHDNSATVLDEGA